METTTLTAAPNANYGIWVIMTDQCRFINFNKCIALMGDVEWRSYEYMGGMEYMATLYFMLNSLRKYFYQKWPLYQLKCFFFLTKTVSKTSQ